MLNMLCFKLRLKYVRLGRACRKKKQYLTLFDWTKHVVLSRYFTLFDWVEHDEKQLKCLVNHMAYITTSGLQEHFTYTTLNIQGKKLNQHSKHKYCIT